MVKEINELTGEVVEFDPKTLSDLISCYRQCSEAVKTYDKVKKKLAALTDKYLNERGVSETVDGYMFRHSSVQRQTYDKSVLRRVLDEDTLDLLLKVDKSAADDYIKEHLAELGDLSTELRKSMVAVGKPYSVIKLEKVR